MQAVKETRVRKRVLVNPIYKDRAVILKSSEETGGEYSLGELTIYPGGGNPLHIHTAFTETFTAVEGTLGVRYGKKKLYLKPGESLTIPLYTPHSFFNDNDLPVVCHIKLLPGHEGFEKGIAIGYGLAADGRTNKKGVPKKLSHFALLISLTDTKMPKLGWLLDPLFAFLAKRAKRKGVEQELTDRYFYE